MLLTDFDASRQAVINPDMLFSPVPDLPATVVSCFSHVTFERMLDMAADVRVLAELGDANAKYPIYRGLWQGTPLTFALAMVGAPSMDMRFNPNASYFAIEGITSPDGRVLGKMGHTERSGENLYKNVPGDKYQPLFEGGVDYFRL